MLCRITFTGTRIPLEPPLGGTRILRGGIRAIAIGTGCTISIGTKDSTLGTLLDGTIRKSFRTNDWTSRKGGAFKAPVDRVTKVSLHSFQQVRVTDQTDQPQQGRCCRRSKQRHVSFCPPPL
eukprot:scaffold39593_cov176-Amphora_coffeaeformis.AAC.5